MEEKSIAIELIKEQSKNQKALTIIICFLVVGVVFSNMAWLYVWNQYDTVDVYSDGQGDAIYQDGEENYIYGQDSSEKEKENEQRAKEKGESPQVGD